MADERRYLAVLRQAARRGIQVGSLSTGTYLLARAGPARRLSLHHPLGEPPAFQEDFPDLDCTNKIYEIDRDRLTCSGGTAAMDMMLHLIADRHGAELARGVANQFHHERIRDERDDQQGGSLEAHAPAAERCAPPIGLMQRHIEDPLTLPDIAKRVSIESAAARAAVSAPLRA